MCVDGLPAPSDTWSPVLVSCEGSETSLSQCAVEPADTQLFASADSAVVGLRCDALSSHGENPIPSHLYAYPAELPNMSFGY